MFTETDKTQLTDKGINQSSIEAQLARFKQGFPAINITSAATLNNGILKLSDEQISSLISQYEHAEVEVLKFVPASGAATRMFKSLFAFSEQAEETEDLKSLMQSDQSMAKFFEELKSFAFYSELSEAYINRNGHSIGEALNNGMHGQVLDALLLSDGLNYGSLPKGLLAFHAYSDETRTPAAEHLQEGISYAVKSNQVNIHFTVSPEHLEAFKKHVARIIDQLGSDLGFSISYSIQKPETDTIAATMDGEPFRDSDGKLLFRPAGHGALLENLNDIEQELIFVKNIDNVVTDRHKAETIRFKKALAGVLLDYQARAFGLLEKHDLEEDISEEGKSLLEQMGVRGFKESEIPNLLNRPIRVCGMVKNEGEPGGGPFWVQGEHFESLQIVESAQIDMSDASQVDVFKNGTHFNPVDLVCGVKNYKGEKFDLRQFRDEEAGFISEKSFQGRQLQAMELPGLWNGAMAHWNTIFVEVPLITFNPVKTVNDLLKPAHH